MKETTPMNTRSKPLLSIITPTLREAPNIPYLVQEISSVLDPVMAEWELIIVDDDSQDGIAGVCAHLQRRQFPLRLVVRKGTRGLATAVLAGCKTARGKILVVMDADLSHQATDILKLYEAVLNGAEFALGSRYVREGPQMTNGPSFAFLIRRLPHYWPSLLLTSAIPCPDFSLCRDLW